MLQQLPAVAFAPWTSINRGVPLDLMEFKMCQLSISNSSLYQLKFGIVYNNAVVKIRPEISSCTYKRPSRGRNMKKHEILPQNVDLPPVLPKKKKKPYPIPLKKIQQAARADKKLAQMGIEKHLEPPKNGLLVPDLIPVAYGVLDAWKVLIRGLSQLLHVIPVHACRIPAVVELCIQAGVELPEFPSRRRTQPVRMIGKKVIDMGGVVEEPRPHIGGSGSLAMEFDTDRALERFPPPTDPEIPMIAQETVSAYEKVKWGVTKLMKKYSVKACGYCSEVHVGPWGHNAKLCGEFKHQWRDGKHGWQDATVDEVFPPNYVWHVEDPKGPPLASALRRFYGKAPAVIELCMQAGARVPKKYRPMMRADIVVPENEEARLVA